MRTKDKISFRKVNQRHNRALQSLQSKSSDTILDTFISQRRRENTKEET